jgi:carbamoyltransferase
MEFGERALGSRSILADPRNAEMKDKVNATIKYRESFRPFAPSILAENAHDYFELPDGADVRFMEQVYKVRPERRDLVPAIVHADGTGRLHMVRREDNALYHALIEHVALRTGVPVVLNTSFNLNGEPIVCTPDDAIRTFMTSGLDALVIGPFLLEKDGSVHGKRADGFQKQSAPQMEDTSMLTEEVMGS